MLRGRSSLRLELGAPTRRHLVVARAAVGLRHAPFGLDERALCHAMERLEERGVHDVHLAAGAFLEPARDFEAVHRPPGEGLEDENVEGAFEQGHGRVRDPGTPQDYTLRVLVRKGTGCVKWMRPAARR